MTKAGTDYFDALRKVLQPGKCITGWAMLSNLAVPPSQVRCEQG